MREREEAAMGTDSTPSHESGPSHEDVQRKTLKADSYFSDEDASDQD